MRAPGSHASPQPARYILFDEIASGGMASVHLGRLQGAAGFSRIVAIKRMHPHFSREPEFVSMFLNEAHMVSRIQHPNVVPTVDVVGRDGELLLVMEYVQGETLSALLRTAAQSQNTLDEALVGSIMAGALHGLHAAHEARDSLGKPLGIIHRDVSPQNIIVGVDGAARVLDFGVAKAAMQIQTTREGQLKGKIAYMSPEQLLGGPIDRRADVFAAGIVHWEALTGCRLFTGGDVGEVTRRVLTADIAPPSSMVPQVSDDLDDIVMRALDRQPSRRFATAREYAVAIESAGPLMLARQVGEWVEEMGGEALRKRSGKVAELERLISTKDETSDDRLTVPGAIRRGASGRKKGGAMIGATVVVAIALVAVALTSHSNPARPTSDRLSSSPAVASPAKTIVERPAPPQVVDPSPAEAPVTSVEKKVAPPPRLRPTPIHSPAMPSRDCDPPYRFDARGIRRVRPGCG